MIDFLIIQIERGVSECLHFLHSVYRKILLVRIELEKHHLVILMPVVTP